MLSKEYAKERSRLINPDRNDPDIRPGDPYPFEGKTNPFSALLKSWVASNTSVFPIDDPKEYGRFLETFQSGTTSIEAADELGWVVSVTPSGGWIPACIAGNTGIGMSQRMQSFVLDEKENPFNVLVPGKRPRVTLTPTLAMKDGKPFLAFGKQGGDEQDQLLLQFFLNVAEFGMTIQEACEAPSFKTLQMYSSFGEHEKITGGLVLNNSMPEWVRKELTERGYRLSFQEKTSGPVNAIGFDHAHDTFWGGSSNYGEDYGIGW